VTHHSVELTEFDQHINEVEFAEALARKLLREKSSPPTAAILAERLMMV
jgi:hypothetical protein